MQVYFIKPDGFVGALGCLYQNLKDYIKMWSISMNLDRKYQFKYNYIL